MDKIYSSEQQQQIKGERELRAELGACSLLRDQIDQIYNRLIGRLITCNDEARSLGLNYEDVGPVSKAEIQDHLNSALAELHQQFYQAPVVELPETLSDAS